MFKKRVGVEAIRKEDFSAFEVMLTDPDVVYDLAHPFTLQQAQTWIRNELKRYTQTGLGMRAVRLPGYASPLSKMPIGLAGICYEDFYGTALPVLRVMLRSEFQHMGYATEAAVYTLAMAFKTNGFSVIYAFVGVNNEPFKRLVTRVGMKRYRFVQMKEHGEMRGYIIYRIKRYEFPQARERAYKYLDENKMSDDAQTARRIINIVKSQLAADAMQHGRPLLPFLADEINASARTQRRQNSKAAAKKQQNAKSNAKNPPAAKNTQKKQQAEKSAQKKQPAEKSAQKKQQAKKSEKSPADKAE